MKVNKKHQCSGCHACYNVCPQDCIQMVPDEEGFAYPVIDLQRCTNCNMCESVSGKVKS